MHTLVHRRPVVGLVAIPRSTARFFVFTLKTHRFPLKLVCGSAAHRRPCTDPNRSIRQQLLICAALLSNLSAIPLQCDAGVGAALHAIHFGSRALELHVTVSVVHQLLIRWSIQPGLLHLLRVGESGRNAHEFSVTSSTRCRRGRRGGDRACHARRWPWRRIGYGCGGEHHNPD